MTAEAFLRSVLASVTAGRGLLSQQIDCNGVAS